jgi:hypothetical protein
LLGRPPTVTTTFPVVAPVGTATTILVADQLVGVAVVLLKVTTLVPFAVPKLVPVIVTTVPIAPAEGDRFVIAGVNAAAGTVYGTSAEYGLTKPDLL